MSDALTWTALLGRWLDFAKASVALPDDTDGDRWRASIAPIINLQAVTFALAELDRLERDERALARDKAELLITGAVKSLEATWGREPMPPMVLETCGDARAALDRSVFAGSVELIWPGPGTMIMPAVDVEPGGTIAVMQPGTIVMPGEPVAWWIDRDGVEIEGCERRATSRPRQVYRRLDETGRITADLVAPIDELLPAGLPLLVPLYEEGRPIGHFTMDADEWLTRQHAAMDGEVPVERI